MLTLSPSEAARLWVPLASGKCLHLADPNPADIDIYSIALGLSRECRYSGQIGLTVAQHSVTVSYQCSRQHALAGLLHDAPEGLGLRDLSRRLKRLECMAGYNELNDRVWRAVAQRFGLDPVLPPEVHAADRLVYYTEVRDLWPHPLPDADWAAEVEGKPTLPITLWMAPQEEALSMFLRRYEELTGERVAG